MCKNPCWSCGFNEEDIGCTAHPYEPWTVPKDCFMYEPLSEQDMIEFYTREVTSDEKAQNPQ